MRNRRRPAYCVEPSIFTKTMRRILKPLCLTLLLGTISGTLMAQTSDILQHVQTPTPGAGSVEVIQEAAFKQLLRENAEYNALQVTLEGFRIQLYSGSGIQAKKEALVAKTKFLGLFPNESIYVIYTAPFWRVRVGDFRFKNEALPLLNQVKKHFPSSYAVKDNNIKITKP